MSKKAKMLTIGLYLGVLLSATVFVNQARHEIFNWKFYTSILSFICFMILFAAFLFFVIRRGKNWW